MKLLPASFDTSTLQFRILLLVILAMIPGLMGSIWFARSSESSALEFAFKETRLISNAAGNLLELTLQQSRQFLKSAANSSSVQALNPDACDSPALQVQLPLSGSEILSLLSPDGEVICSQAGSKNDIPAIHGAPWFMEAAALPHFYVSDAWQDPVTTQWKTVFTYPVQQPGVGLIGILALTIDLAVLKEFIFQDIPPEALVVVVGTDHRVVMRSKLHENRVGKPIPERFVGLMQNKTQTNLAERGIDDVERLYAAEKSPISRWVIWAALPELNVMAPYRDQLNKTFLTILPLVFLLLALTFFLVNRTLIPVKSLAKTARAVSAGNLSARASLKGPREIRLIAEEFNWMLDITSNAQTELTASVAFNRGVINGLQSQIVVIDQEGVILMVNDAWLEFAEANGATQLAEQFVGMNYLNVCEAANQGPDADKSAKGIRSVLSGDCQRYEMQYSYHYLDKQRWFQMTCSPLPDPNAGAVIAHVDITALKQMEETVRQQAYFDSLTGLPNRRLLSDRMNQARAAMQRSRHLCGLMVLDLDNFKPLNDQYGHTTGDLLLVEVGTRLNDCVRSVDTVARFGGDEFVVLLSGLSKDLQESIEEAILVAEKIRIRLSETYILPTARCGPPETMVEHHCTVTIGVTVFSSVEADLDTIFNLADSAMYQAKAAGGNTVRFATASSADRV